MKILLTGGSGFLGGALAVGMHDAGHEVAMLLRPESSLARVAERWFDTARCIGDAEIEAFVERVQPDAIVHTACVYGRKQESLLQLEDVNVRLGLILLQKLSTLQFRGRPRLFLNTGTSLPAEISNYAMTKQHFSQWGRRQAAAATQDLQFINVQLEHMYGAGDSTSKFTTNVLHSCHRNDPSLHLTLGEQKRDFIYIEDVVSAYLTLLSNSESLDTIVDIPVGFGEAISVRHFVETVRDLLGSRTALDFGALPYRPHEAMSSRADISHMEQLGWHPRFNLRTGLSRTIELEFALRG